METIVVLGADQSTIRAALLLRRIKQRARILVFPWSFQTPCIIQPLVPFYLKGDVEEDTLVLYTNEMLRDALRIQVMKPVEDIDLDERVVETNDQVQGFDRMLISLNEEILALVGGKTLSLSHLRDLKTMRCILEQSKEVSLTGSMPIVLDVASAVKVPLTLYPRDIERYLDKEILEKLEEYTSRVGIYLHGERKGVQIVLKEHINRVINKILEHLGDSTYEDLLGSSIVAYGSLVPALNAVTQMKYKFKEWPTIDNMARMAALSLSSHRPILRGFLKYYWWRLRNLFIYTMGLTEAEALSIYDNITSTRVRLENRSFEVIVKAIAERRERRILGIQAVSFGIRLDNIFSLLLPIRMRVPLDSIVPVYIPDAHTPFRDAINIMIEALWRKLFRI